MEHTSRLKLVSLSLLLALNTQAGLIATRMPRARAIWGKAIGRSIVSSPEFDYLIKLIVAHYHIVSHGLDTFNDPL
jgi:hypothetical protein